MQKKSFVHEIGGSKKDLLIIFSLALILHSLFLLRPYETGDSYEYRTYASNIIKYNRFSYSENPPIVSSTFRTPVYPVFIAMVYSAFGMKDIFVYLAQVIISALTCLVMYFIAVNLFDRRIAFLAGIVITLHPFLGWFVSTLLTETLFTFLLSVTVLFILRAIKLNKIRLFFLSGILLGVTTLCKPTTLFLFIFVASALLFIFNKKDLAIKYIAILFIGFTVSLLPWTLRNYIVTKRFIPITTEGPANLYIATLDSGIFDDVKQNNFYAGGQRDTLFKRHLLNVHNDQALRQVSKEMWEKAIIKIKNNPLAFIFKRVKYQFYLWAGSNYMIETTWPEAISRRAYGIIIAKFIITVFLHIFPISMYLFAGWLLKSDWRKYLLVYLIPIYFAILHFPIHIEMRYSMPAYPYILIFCVYAILDLAARTKSKITGNN